MMNIKNIFIQKFQFNDSVNFIIVSPHIEEIKNKFLDTTKFYKIKFLELKFEEKNIKQIVDCKFLKRIVTQVNPF